MFYTHAKIYQKLTILSLCTKFDVIRCLCVVLNINKKPSCR